MKKKQSKRKGDPLSNKNLRVVENFKNFSDEELGVVRDFTQKYVSILKDFLIKLMEEKEMIEKNIKKTRSYV